ncbi:matrixin family metalloprotease [Rhodopirellula sp. P2]|uniref:matrixin family metalloprotease n=1 Tax=Rhodopirellula sp. P2 TaxID=2127060 RepID=UPI00236848F3|nr:matrixin family metalloprotease [Rhodopirellula sp. P2]WDQ15927.1 matrixin family metalloprotease [Rhodopirellula sp. P2]
MKFRVSLALVCLFTCLPSPHSQAALTIDLDYSLDSNGFFGAAGSAQRASLEAARDVYQNLISQSFNAITPGTVYNAGTVLEFQDSWSANFSHPGTGNSHSITDLSLGSDTIRIFVGGRDLGGNTLGQAGRGGFGASGIGTFVQSISRGDSGASFGLWGGAATFDTATNWNFDVANGPGAAESDFFSVAIHEFGHVLGLGASSDAWDDHWTPGVDGGADSSPGTEGQFDGAAALAAYNADNGLNAAFVPTVAAMVDDPGTLGINEEDLTNRHFADGTLSYIYGTTTLQEVALDPNITVGTRKLLTNVDVAALSDLGWTINATAVPEPSGVLLLAVGALTIGIRRRSRAGSAAVALVG